MLELSWLQQTPPVVIALVLFIMLIIFYSLGYQLHNWNLKKGNIAFADELGPINGALLGLLALLLAFTFSMSNSRYDARRQSITEEANAIGTAILRTEVYPDSIRRVLRQQLKAYVEARVAFNQSGLDVQQLVTTYKRADELGKQVWTTAAEYARKDNLTTRTAELLPALNAMIDITTTRRAAGQANIPDSILYFLFILCLGSSFLLGYGIKNKVDWVVAIGFSLMLSATVYTIMDLDRPRTGLITIETPSKKIAELLDMFNE